jgi:hypothetical protein
MDSIDDILTERFTLTDEQKKRRRMIAIAAAMSGGGVITDDEEEVVHTPPVLTWVTGVTDNTPDFSIAGAEAATTIDVQISAAADFLVVAQTVSGAQAGNPTTLTATALADGLWYARSKYTGSDWSNTVSKTLDTTVLRQAMAGTSFINLNGTRQAQHSDSLVNEINH